MKKTFAILTAVSLSVGLCACSNSASSSSKSAEAKVSEAVTAYVKSKAGINGNTFKSMEIINIRQDSTYVYIVTGKYSSTDESGKTHNYNFEANTTYYALEDKVVIHDLKNSADNEANNKATDETIEEGVKNYVKSRSSVRGKFDRIEIADISKGSDKYEYNASGKYWVKDNYGDSHCYKFNVKLSYIGGEVTIGSYDFKDSKVY